MNEQERAERARGFLRRLRVDQDARDAVALATDADLAPEEVDEDYCAALDRVLVAWAVEVISGTMRELGVDEIVVRNNT